MNPTRQILPKALGIGALTTTMVAALVLATGCGATCERIETDRRQFFARKPTGGTHIEMIIPFATVERLALPQIAAIKPIALPIPNLGKLSEYFGDLTIVPTRVSFKPAAADHIGFHLDFEVRRNDRKAFTMYMETDVKPTIDIENRKIVLGFTPDALQKARVKFSKDAVDDLSAIIYEQIPSVARFLIPQSMVEKAAASAVEMLTDTLYSKLKGKMLPKLAASSSVEIALPRIPLSEVHITSSLKGNGRLRLAITTALPVEAGIDEAAAAKTEPSTESVTLRVSGAAAAELVNWAMAEKLIAFRYDRNGKSSPDGELRPGLAWARGEERAMKIYLWDLEKPCMRLTMSARPSIAVADGKLEIKAEDAENDDIEASAFTKVGTWFYLLWKDPMHLDKKSDAVINLTAGEKELKIIVKKASVEKDELIFEVRPILDNAASAR